MILNGNCAQVLGTATVNGAPGFGFDVIVCEQGEPGKSQDVVLAMDSTTLPAAALTGGAITIE